MAMSLRFKFAKPDLSVLTDPIPWRNEFFMEYSRKFIRYFRNKIYQRKKYIKSKYRGHFAVTRSLVEGLNKLNVDFNYNPKLLGCVAETVVVLSGIRTLRQAIRLKRLGYIKRLLVGPNVVTFVKDDNFILEAAEIDLIITPSVWVKDLYLADSPSLIRRIITWPAGVDVNYWCPSDNKNTDRILIYAKSAPGSIPNLNIFVTYLNDIGFTVDVINYGNFTHAEYREKLANCCAVIGFVASESQGIAWAEAWAMDRATLIWQNTTGACNGRRFKSSPAPYLCRENGLMFADFADFKDKIQYLRSNLHAFSPRKWVLQNMSDAVCAKKLYEIVMHDTRVAINKLVKEKWC